MRSGRRFLIEAILFLSYAVFSMSWMAIAPLAKELMAWFGVSRAQFALLSTVVTINKVVAPLVAGAVAVKLGVKNTILIGMFFVAIAIVGPVFPRFSVFLLTRALFGVGGAVLVTLMPVMVMQWFPREELAVVNGLNGVAANTGFALAMSLTVPLATQTSLGWKGTLLAYSAASVALFLAWALFGRENRTGPAVAKSTAPAGRQASYRAVWKKKETWLIALAFTGPVALYLTFSLWLPTYYREEFKFTALAATRYTAFILYPGILTAVLAGLATQKVGLRRPFLIWGGALSGLACFGTFLSPSPALIMVSNVLLGVGLFLPTAALMTLLMELEADTPANVALISGTMISFCYSLNSFIPNLVGWISDKAGTFVPAFILVAVFSWVVVLAGFLLPETGPRARLQA